MGGAPALVTPHAFADRQAEDFVHCIHGMGRGGGRGSLMASDDTGGCGLPQAGASPPLRRTRTTPSRAQCPLPPLTRAGRALAHAHGPLVQSEQHLAGVVHLACRQRGRGRAGGDEGAWGEGRGEGRRGGLAECLQPTACASPPRPRGTAGLICKAGQAGLAKPHRPSAAVVPKGQPPPPALHLLAHPRGTAGPAAPTARGAGAWDPPAPAARRCPSAARPPGAPPPRRRRPV